MENQDCPPVGPDLEILPVEFKFESQSVRTITINGDVWFVATDVCDVLEHTSATKVIARLEESEKSAIEINTGRGVKETNIISESGLYSLILTSRKPQAKAFKRWVTQEVLPSIARTGRYDGRAAAGKSDQDGYCVLLPETGHYSVTVARDGRYHAYRSDYDMVLEEDNIATVRLLCHQIGVIAGLWAKSHVLRQGQRELNGTGMLRNFDEVMRQSSEMASHILATYR